MNFFKKKDEEDSMATAGAVPTPDAPVEKMLSTFDIWVIMLNNVFGVVVFLRWGYAVGHAGLGLTLICILIGLLIALSTCFSLAALITNGAQREYAPGGVYYYLTRSIGAEIGSVVGMIFYIANGFSIAFYLLGFGEVVNSTFTIPVNPAQLASIALAFCYITVVGGQKLFAKVSSIVFYAILLGIAMGILGLFLQKPGVHIPRCSEPFLNHSAGFVGPSPGRLRLNLNADYGPKPAVNNHAVTTKHDFLSIFGICYPSMSGVLGGANLAGQTDNPSRAIPNGTLWGILTMGIIYTVICFANAASVARDCLKADFYIMQDVCWTPYLPMIGAVASTVSSGLSALAGASRILQAIAHDGVFPLLFRLKRTKDSKETPHLCYLLTYGIAQALILGNASVDTVAPLLTNLVLLTFCLINFSCFLLTILKIPNFRPRYQWYSKYQAGVGALLCFIIMFCISPSVALLSWVLCILTLFYLMFFIRPINQWGELGEAIYPLISRFVANYAKASQESSKYWRPNIVVVSRLEGNLPFLRFGTTLGKGGFITVGHAMTGNIWSNMLRNQRVYDDFSHLLNDNHIKNNSVILSNTGSVAVGVSNILMGVYGGYRPNTLVLGWTRNELVTVPPPTCVECNHAMPVEITCLDCSSGMCKACSDMNHATVLRKAHRRVIFSPEHAALMAQAKETIGLDGKPTAAPPTNPVPPPVSLEEYMKVLSVCYTMRKNIVLLRNTHKLKSDDEVLAAAMGSGYQAGMYQVGLARDDKGSKRGLYVDVLCFIPDPNMDFGDDLPAALQYATIFQTKTLYSTTTRKRIIVICEKNMDIKDVARKVKELVVLYRYAFEIHVISMEEVKIGHLSLFVEGSAKEKDAGDKETAGVGVDIFDPFEDFLQSIGASPSTTTTTTNTNNNNNNNNNNNSASANLLDSGFGIMAPEGAGVPMKKPDVLKSRSDPRSLKYPAGFDYEVCKQLNELVRIHSQKTLATFMAVPSSMVSPVLHKEEIQQALQTDAIPEVLENCLRAIDVITFNLPPVGVIMPTGQKMMQLTLSGEASLEVVPTSTAKSSPVTTTTSVPVDAASPFGNTRTDDDGSKGVQMEDLSKL